MNTHTVAIIFFVCLLISPIYAFDSASYATVPLTELNLNCRATKLSSTQMDNLPHVHTGFIWNNDDNGTDKWRPQGITGFTEDGRKFLAVSWYGRNEADYASHGARISLVDVTKMNAIRYRHILLVDGDFQPFAGIHAGGLAFRRGELHVPDTRSGFRRVHVFSIRSILAVPNEDREHFFNNEYLLKQAYSYDVQEKPSFISYDRTRDAFVIGTFSRKRAQSLQWYGAQNKSIVTGGPFFKEMQGVVSGNGRLWVACSYGRYNRSRLYWGAYTPGETPDLSRFTEIHYPAGLEDMHMSKTSDNIWMLTEFGPHEGFSNNRLVFAVRMQSLTP